MGAFYCIKNKFVSYSILCLFKPVFKPVFKSDLNIYFMGFCNSKLCGIDMSIQKDVPCEWNAKILSEYDLISISIDEFKETECLICCELITKHDPRPLRCDISKCKISCHAICIYKWFNNKPVCPICNSKWICPPEIYFPDNVLTEVYAMRQNMNNILYTT